MASWFWRGQQRDKLVVVLGVAAIVAARYIARGVGSRELYVLAGVGMGLAVVVRFFVMPMMSRRR